MKCKYYLLSKFYLNKYLNNVQTKNWKIIFVFSETIYLSGLDRIRQRKKQKPDADEAEYLCINLFKFFLNKIVFCFIFDVLYKIEEIGKHTENASATVYQLYDGNIPDTIRIKPKHIAI